MISFSSTCYNKNSQIILFSVVTGQTQIFVDWAHMLKIKIKRSRSIKSEGVILYFHNTLNKNIFPMMSWTSGENREMIPFPSTQRERACKNQRISLSLTEVSEYFGASRTYTQTHLVLFSRLHINRYLRAHTHYDCFLMHWDHSRKRFFVLGGDNGYNWKREVPKLGTRIVSHVRRFYCSSSLRSVLSFGSVFSRPIRVRGKEYMKIAYWILVTISFLDFFLICSF